MHSGMVEHSFSTLLPDTSNPLGKQYEIRGPGNPAPEFHDLLKRRLQKEVVLHLGASSFLNSSISSLVMFFSSFGQVEAQAFMIGPSSSLL